MKKKLPWPILVLLILLSPIVIFYTWDAIWDLDPFNMFPAESESGGYVEKVYSRQLVQYENLGARPINVYLIKGDRWYGECYITFSLEGSDLKVLNSKTVHAKAGDEFEFEGYRIRVLRVFPWSLAVFVDGYFMGDVTLEISKLDSPSP
jgi:hypothetical protein